MNDPEYLVQLENFINYINQGLGEDHSHPDEYIYNENDNNMDDFDRYVNFNGWTGLEHDL